MIILFITWKTTFEIRGREPAKVCSSCLSRDLIMWVLFAPSAAAATLEVIVSVELV